MGLLKLGDDNKLGVQGTKIFSVDKVKAVMGCVFQDPVSKTEIPLEISSEGI